MDPTGLFSLVNPGIDPEADKICRTRGAQPPHYRSFETRGLVERNAHVASNPDKRTSAYKENQCLLFKGIEAGDSLFRF